MNAEPTREPLDQAEIDPRAMDDFFSAFLKAAQKYTTCEPRNDDPVISIYSASDLPNECVAPARLMCELFYRIHYDEIGNDVRECGEAFWLSRSGSLCGFAEGGLGMSLEQASVEFGSVSAWEKEDLRGWIMAAPESKKLMSKLRDRLLDQAREEFTQTGSINEAVEVAIRLAKPIKGWEGAKEPLLALMQFASSRNLDIQKVFGEKVVKQFLPELI